MADSFIQITEDGGVTKKILTPGTGEQIPQKGQKVEGIDYNYVF